MIDISFSEVFVVLFVALIVTRPKDYPKVISSLRKLLRHFFEWKSQIMEIFNKIADEADLANVKASLDEEVKRINTGIKKIVDMEGNIREAYDVKELENIAKLSNYSNKKDIVH